MSRLVEFKIHYIGNIHEWGIECKHGIDECVGNKQQLCAYELYHSNSLNWFSFINCINQDLFSIPSESISKKCASEWNLDYSSIQKCMNSEYGQNLLNASVMTSVSRNVSTSCTVHIGGQLRCVHDGFWKECTDGYQIEDFIKSICKDYIRATQIIPSECMDYSLLVLK